MSIRFTVNGALQVVDPAEGEMTLLDYLHDALNLTGTKLCCGIGVCRACTVSIEKDGAASAVISCSMPLSLLDRANVRTIEDVAQDGQPSPIQEDFLANFAFQCGYCAPGFVMAATVFLEQLASAPVREDQLEAAIEDAVGQHICRCTGYVRYYEAILARARTVLAEKEA
jgi:aerobic-type carbon monoxide dehydrogenase small subunit (CoxS/CutS family)